MLHFLEIIENIQIAQLNFEKNSFGRLPKSRYLVALRTTGNQNQLDSIK